MHGGRRLSPRGTTSRACLDSRSRGGGATLGCEILDVEEPTIIIIGHMLATCTHLNPWQSVGSPSRITFSGSDMERQGQGVPAAASALVCRVDWTGTSHDHSRSDEVPSAILSGYTFHSATFHLRKKIFLLPPRRTRTGHTAPK